MAQPVLRPERGRGVVRTGLVLILVGLVLGGLAIAYGLLFAGRLAETPVAFPNPGSVSAHLTPGKWAIYGLHEKGVTKVAYESQLKATGPATVTIRSTVGFFGETATIVVDGKEYEVFAKFDVVTEGDYTIDIARRDFDESTTTAMLAPYMDSLATGLWVFLGIMLVLLFGFPGFITLVVGLFMRRGTKKQLAQVAAGGPGYGAGGPYGVPGGPGPGWPPAPGAPGGGVVPGAPAGPGQGAPGGGHVPPGPIGVGAPPPGGMAPPPTPDPYVAPYDPTAPPAAPGPPGAPGPLGPPV